MEEFILYLLKKNKTISMDSLSKKTGLDRNQLFISLSKLILKNKVQYLNLANAPSCSCCNNKMFCQERAYK